MTMPRSVVAGKTYLITRRCCQRQFLLRPSKELNRVVGYLLGLGCAVFGVQMHAACFMSNHYHLVVTDENANLPDFMCFFNGLLAKCVNRMLGRREAVFAPGSYDRVEILDRDGALGELIYTLANPVKAGLVTDGRRWPGVRLGPWQLDKILTVRKPEGFFRVLGPLPDKETLCLAVPPQFADMSRSAYQRRLAEGVSHRERELAEDRRRDGKPFVGERRVLAQVPFDTPNSPPERGRKRLFVTSDPEEMERAVKQHRTWLEAYDQARTLHREKVQGIVFPFGTYWLRIHVGVRCAPPD